MTPGSDLIITVGMRGKSNLPGGFQYRCNFRKHKPTASFSFSNANAIFGFFFLLSYSFFLCLV